jgi:predicted PurR-regulated permease PerM
MLGPVTSIALILVVAGFAGLNLWPVIIFVVVFRMVQDYVISPHLMGHGVELHPLLVLFGVFAGAEIAGIAGTFLSVPVLALVRIVYLRIRKAHLEARHAAA